MDRNWMVELQHAYVLFFQIVCDEDITLCSVMRKLNICAGTCVCI